MFELHLAYRDTPRLRALLDVWDEHVAAEGPVTQHRWTDIALWPAARSATVGASTALFPALSVTTKPQPSLRGSASLAR